MTVVKIHFPVELVHEGDASFLTGHLLLTCHTLLGTIFVIGSLHKLSSVMMHGELRLFWWDIFWLLA